jgi:DNA-binding transcriptional ArsR family regulator
MTTSSVLLHPVRLRIVQSLLGNDELTTLQLHERLPDVPIATLYRHVGQLVRNGLIEIAQEVAVRGASERSYRIAPGFANPTAEELGSLSPEELITMFTVFASGIIRDFDAYVSHKTPDLVEDRVSFAQADFWATNEEVDEFFETVMGALRSLLANSADGGRRRRALTTVLIPRPHDAPTPRTDAS